MKAALLSIFGFAVLPAPVLADDRTEQVAGWTLSDVGGKLGNDFDREVAMIRKAPGVEIAFRPGPGRSGSVSAKFEGCDKSSEYTAGLQFKSSADAVRSIRDEIGYDFAEFRKECPATADSEKAVMQGFDKAFETITRWVKDKPFVYPSDAPAKPQPAVRMDPKDMT